MASAPSGIPRYHQIAQVLRSRLEARELGHEGAFTTEYSLCAEFGASRTTIRHALGFLKREGLLTSRPGVGTHGTPAEAVNRAVRPSGDPLHGMLKRRPRIVEFGKVAPPPLAAKFFAIDDGSPVLRITRVHDLDRMPLSVVRTYLPARLATGAARSEWRKPMHDLLRERFGLRLHRSVHTLRLARAMADIAALLEISLADPVLHIQASTYLADGAPIRWTENFFRENRYEYVAKMEWPVPDAQLRDTTRQ